jgi:hypothetical protein
MSTLIGVVMVLGGFLLIVFRRGASGFINESDEMALPDRPNPLGKSSPLPVLLSGVGLLAFGLWILWNSSR